jgi:hypothetical protein
MGNRQGQYIPPQVDSRVITENNLHYRNLRHSVISHTFVIHHLKCIFLNSLQYGPNSYGRPVTLPGDDSKLNETEYQPEKNLSIPPNHSTGTVALYDYRNVKYFGGFDVKSAMKGVAMVVIVKTKAVAVLTAEKTKAAAVTAATKTKAVAVKAANSQAVMKTRAVASNAAVKTRAVASKAADKTKAVAVSAAIKTKAAAAVAVEKSRAVAAKATTRTKSEKHVSISEDKDIPVYDTPMLTAYV